MSLLVSLLAIAGRIVPTTLLNTGEWQSQGTDSAFPLFNLVPLLILLLFALGIAQYNPATLDSEVIVPRLISNRTNEGLFTIGQAVTEKHLSLPCFQSLGSGI